MKPAFINATFAKIGQFLRLKKAREEYIAKIRCGPFTRACISTQKPTQGMGFVTK